MSDDQYQNKVCRHCGTEPKPWEDLVDGLCPECSFTYEIDGELP